MTYPGPPAPPPQAPGPTDNSTMRLAFVGIVVVGLIAIAALVVGVIGLSRSDSSATEAQPSVVQAEESGYTAAEAESAKNNLCAAYKVAADSVRADTHRDDTALARISLSNSAGLLDAATDNPALDDDFRETARSLAEAYRTSNAIASVAEGRSSPKYVMTVDEVNRIDADMAEICD